MGLTQITTGGVDDNINIDNNTLKVDGTNNRVGIGTNSPSNNLHVYDGSANTLLRVESGTATARINIVDSAGQAFVSCKGDDLTFDTSSSATERVRIDSSGRLLVGTSSAIQTSTNSVLQLKHADGAQIILARDDSAIATNMDIGAIRFYGNDGGSYQECARIAAEADGNHANNDKPTALRFYTTADGGSSPTERVRIDSSGNVGIGTTAPNSLLEIRGTSDGQNVLHLSNTAGSSDGDAENQLRVTCNGNTNWGNLDIQAYRTIFSQNGSERMRIDSSGRLLINNTNAVGNFPLQVTATTNANAIAIIGRSSDDIGELSFYENDRTTILGELQYRQDHLNLRHRVGDIRFATGGVTERMRIDSSGRVLIGTTSNGAGDPRYSKLHVVGNSLNNEGFFRIGRNENTGDMSSGDILGKIFFTDSSGDTYAQIHCVCDGTPGSNDFPGRLVFSTSTDNLGSPSEKMLIKQNGQISSYCTGQYARVIESSRSAGTSSYLLFGRHSAGSITGSGGTQSFAVYTNGNVQNTNNSYGSLSDAKLKENIVDASSQWDDIKEIRVRNYNFIEGQTHTQIGVVAQEVETVSPGLVFDTPDLDEEGNDLGTVTKSVNYSVLYVKAVKALQEAMDRIETLEAKVAALEAAE